MTLLKTLFVSVTGLLTCFFFLLASLYWFFGPEALPLFSVLFEYTGYKSKYDLPLVQYDYELFKKEKIAFYGHVVFSPICLIVGFFQFFEIFRRKNEWAHRLLGFLYFTTQMIGLSCGIYLGKHDYAGMIATYGFYCMGLVPMTCTIVATYCLLVLNDIKAHRHWMLRSYFSMWSSVVLFRLAIMFWIPGFLYQKVEPGIDQQQNKDHFYEPYIISLYLSWSLPVVVADLYIQFTEPRRYYVSSTIKGTKSQ